MKEFIPKSQEQFRQETKDMYARIIGKTIIRVVPMVQENIKIGLDGKMRRRF